MLLVNLTDSDILIFMNLMDTDTDIGEIDTTILTWTSKLVHQSFPEVNSLAPNPLQPFHHLLPLNLTMINHFTITIWCWNYATMQFCQTLKALPVLCLSPSKHPTTKDDKKVLSNRGLFDKYHDWNHMWWDFVQIDSWPAWWDFYCFVIINSDGGHRDFFIGLVWTFHEVNLNLVAIMIYRGWWHWRRWY